MKVNGLKSEISERCWKKWNEKSEIWKKGRIPTMGEELTELYFDVAYSKSD